MGETSGLGCGSLTIKYLVFLFNLVFFISGLLLIVVGGIAQGFFKEYIQFFDNELKTPAMGLIILGCIILVVSFFGCCGAKMENVFMLRVFSFLLGLLLVCEIIAGISVGILKSDVEDALVKNMHESMQQYGNNTLSKETWDKMQASLHCCGTNNYTDWNETDWSMEVNVPDSCCKVQEPDCGAGILVNPAKIDTVYQNGCSGSLIVSARHNLGAIIGVAVGIAVIQLIGIWMSCCLVRFVKENYEVL